MGLEPQKKQFVVTPTPRSIVNRDNAFIGFIQLLGQVLNGGVEGGDQLFDTTQAVKNAQIDIDNLRIEISGLLNGNLIFISEKAELPTPVAGVITLADNTAYYLTDIIDLAGDRIVAGQNTAIIGSSPEICGLISTGLVGTALITGNFNILLSGIFITADVALDLDGIGNNASLDWAMVNFVDCPTIGTIKDYSNLIGEQMAFLDSANLTMTGVFGTIGFSDSISVGLAGQTTFIMPAALTITRRFRFTYSALVAFGGGSVFDLNVNATIPVEGYILDTCAFSGGGAYLLGVQPNDNKARVIECTGIANSATVSGYSMVGNATATVIAAANTPVKIAGTTVSNPITQRFDNSVNNRAQFTGAVNHDCEVTVTATLSSTNNTEMSICIAKNGVPIPETAAGTIGGAVGKANSVSTQALSSMVPTDQFEVWVENLTNAQNITAVNLNFIIKSVSE